MKDIKEYIVDESRTSDNQIKEYVNSWLGQDRKNYRRTTLLILSAMMDFFKSEMAYNLGTKEYEESADLYSTVIDAYQLF
jgi:hypothetical protein